MRMQMSSVGGDIQPHEISMIRRLFGFFTSPGWFLHARVREFPGEGTIVKFNKTLLPLSLPWHGASRKSGCTGRIADKR